MQPSISSHAEVDDRSGGYGVFGMAFRLVK
ncbi:hypothetical protein SAMN05421548_101374 [Paraburkholderia lycopersici]|uniref:Uncharacterized protein n=1 Tax=Paraburkholderia lycopersici TaxID=416944 RepID=A0A1G6GV42_9BURK|nr:hypothetical protein SAMN05421548_101374 [Paraburkholderia lycopersici]